MKHTTLLLALAALAATSCSLQLDSQYGLRWEPTPIVRSEPTKGEATVYPAEVPAEVHVPLDPMIALNPNGFPIQNSQALELDRIHFTAADTLPESAPESDATPLPLDIESITESPAQEAPKSDSVGFFEFILALGFFAGFLASLGAMGAIISLTNWSGPGSMAGPGNLLGTFSAVEGLLGVIAMGGIALLCLIIIKALIS